MHPAAASLEQRAVQQQEESLCIQVSIKEATSTAEFRAAGYLRAYSFYTYPADRSELSARVRAPALSIPWLCELAQPGLLSVHERAVASCCTLAA
jgi:hypothetical protein